jgi:regulatory protein
MAGRRRGRTGRGWDAAPPRARSQARPSDGDSPEGAGEDDGTDPDGWPAASTPAERPAEPPSGSTWGGGRWGRRPAAAGRPGRGSVDGKETDPAELAREICLRQLAVRPRTRAELATVLRQRGIADEVANEVLERYGEVGIIDDSAFARAWVSSRHYSRGLASRALANELRRKGVDAEAVGAALADLDPDIEEATARSMVERKLRSDRGGPAEAKLRRLVGMLARKGYPPGMAIKVVRDVLAERAAAEQDDEQDEEQDEEQQHGDEGDLDDLGLDLVADQLETEASAADAN